MRLFFRLLAVASLLLGVLVMVFSFIVAGPGISAGLVVGFILVLNGAVRLYAAEEE